MPKKESNSKAAVDLFAKEATAANAMEDEKFGSLSKRCNDLVALSCKIAERQAATAELNKELRLMTKVEVPEMMMELGIEEIKTKLGNKITLGKFYSAKIPADKEEEAFKWLEDTDNGGLIKSKVEISFGKGDKEREAEERVVEALIELDAPFTQKRGVHHSTLKAFVKNRIEDGESIDRELFGVYVGDIVKIGK